MSAADGGSYWKSEVATSRRRLGVTRLCMLSSYSSFKMHEQPSLVELPFPDGIPSIL